MYIYQFHKQFEENIHMSKRITKEEVMILAESRNQLLLNSGQFDTIYKSVHTKLDFQCKTCNTAYKTSLHSFKNAKKTGCPQCKKGAASETHTGKVVSEETRQKIGAKASERPGSLTGKKGEAHPRYKGGLARDMRNPSTADYEWKNGVRRLYGRSCVITKEKEGVVLHHLDSYDSHPDKRYDVTNGVPLARRIHRQFHDLYGYGKNTEQQFIKFCWEQHQFDWVAYKNRIITQQ